MEVKAHSSSFLDKEFYRLYSDDSVPEKFVLVRALNANWILTQPDGEDFLYALSEIEDVNTFNNEYLQTIVNFMWETYQPLIIKLLFFPYLAYFFLFLFGRTVSFE